MNPIKFNDTSDYTYMTVFDAEGVFSEAYIDSESLPEGFYKYSLQGRHKELIDHISLTHTSKHVGDFITKDSIDLGESGIKALKLEDYSMNSHKEFDFSTHFGCHLSIDCQIRLAEEKRNFQSRQDDRDNVLDTVPSELNM